MKKETFEQAKILTDQLYEIEEKLELWQECDEKTAAQKIKAIAHQIRDLFEEGHLDTEFIDAVNGLLVALLKKKHVQLMQEFEAL